MKQILMRYLFASMCVLLVTNVLNAEVSLPKIIGSNMVLQRNQEIKIWGWADEGERIRVGFNGLERMSRAGEEGEWMVTFPAMKAGGPYDMYIQGKNLIELENILVGDVWVCSGQSNMEWNVERFPWAEGESAEAVYSGIRLITVPYNASTKPEYDVPSSEWQVCSQKTVIPFSAVGYFFGRDIHRELRVPIGLISSNWGGTNIETWISGGALRKMEGVSERLGPLSEEDASKINSEAKEKVDGLLDKHLASSAGILNGDAIWANPDLEMNEWGTTELPGKWESRGFRGLDGVVWFRKEVEITGEMAMRGITLELGPIDDSARTWFNGFEVFEDRFSWDAPRVYPVSGEMVHAGRNVISVRVVEKGGNGGLFGNPRQLKISSGEQVIPLAGEWKYRISPTNLRVNYNVSIPPNNHPTLLFNGMIHPLLNFKVKGVIWYQGESNASRAYQYRELFPLMITDWRKQWDNPEMPFLFVQLANYKAVKDEPGESDWAELREAQRMTLDLPNTGMAVIIDIGEAGNIHPGNKQDVGKRLSLAAMKIAYGKDIVHSGPIFKEMRIEGKQAILSFDHTGSGLLVKDKYGYLKGFAMAGPDHIFYWARARIQDDEVIVYCDWVDEPVAVRYGWADNPDDVNLYNMEGLPASPFRTDDWPGITLGRVYK